MNSNNCLEKLSINNTEHWGCPKNLIKSSGLNLLILAGCFIPPVLAYALSGSDNIMPNNQAVLFLVPMSISFILLPFTGVIRRAIYAKPLLTLLVVFWPLAIFGAIEKTTNPDFDVKKDLLFSIVLWITELTFTWFLPTMGSLLLIMTILNI